MKKYFIHSIVLIYIFGFFGCSDNAKLPLKKVPKVVKKTTKPIPQVKVKKVKSPVIKTIPKKKEESSDILPPPKIIENNISEPLVIIEEIEPIPIEPLKIAIVFPSQVIGKYAIDATNSAMSYLIYKNSDFNLEVFDTVNESNESIKSTFEKIAKQGISKVLVLFTHNGVKYLEDIEDINSYDIYLPLIHKNDLNLDIQSVVFGSIDYSKQFDELLKYSNTKTVEFHDNSDLGKRLANNLYNKVNLVYQKEINNDNAQYHKFITSRNKRLIDSTLVVDMPIIKSSIVLSQINAKEVKVNKILSTQLNYTPLLLSLTQVQDRKNMIIANSIANTNETIEEYNALLDNDIVYNWVNYSTLIGIEYLISQDISSFESINIEDNQVQYPVKLFTTTKFAFQHFN